MKKLLTYFQTFGLLLASVSIASASGLVDPPAQPIIRGADDIIHYIEKANTWIFSLLIVLAVLFILYAAWLYLSAAGDKGKIQKANQIILYAVIAIAVGLLSTSLVSIVRDFLDVRGSGGTISV